jgi:hypothetical protein
MCNYSWLDLIDGAQLSAIFQLYRDGQFYWWRKSEYPKKTTDLSQVSENNQTKPTIITHIWKEYICYLISLYILCTDLIGYDQASSYGFQN